MQKGGQWTASLRLLSHGHEDFIGAVPELLKQINVGVFGTHFTMSLVELALTEAGMNVSDYRLYRINHNKVLKFGNITVQFYSTSHSVPESLGIAIKTEDGALVYAPDFTFASNTDPRYQTSFGNMTEIAKDGVLALFSESLGAANIGRASNDYQLIYAVNEILQNSKRVIFSMFSTELQRIQKIINLCVQNNRRVAIIGKKAQKTINIAVKEGYLQIPPENFVNLKYMTEENRNDDADLAVIITGIRHEPYYTLQRMCNGVDRLIEIKDDDNIIIISQPTTGTEIMAQKTTSLLHRHGAKVTVIPKSMLMSSHADSEDLKMLYSIMKPKYVVPIIGEYRHQVMQKQIALEAGFKEENVIMLENGIKITFENGRLLPEREKIRSGDVLVDGSFVGDINEIVLKDREMLAQDGLVLVVTSVDARLKKIIAGPTVEMKGFVVGETAEEVSRAVSQLSEEIINSFLAKRYIDWASLKNQLKESITKEVLKLTNKNPIIMVSLIDVESK
ncbi:MAG TPA: ribonuclease J [Acholeplasmataceae bacterium]|nr:ribonuclease J [Acholeplasmataceae bacterium]